MVLRKSKSCRRRDEYRNGRKISGGISLANIFDELFPQPIITITSEEDGWVWEIYE